MAECAILNFSVQIVFFVNCSINTSKNGIVNNKMTQSEINSSEIYSFKEYVNLLSNNNKSKTYPDINNIRD